MRLSEDAGVQLSDVTAVANGFDVVNPTDGTRYQTRLIRVIGLAQKC